jgi:DNA-binding CsgD family transcriptional regulator
LSTYEGLKRTATLLRGAAVGQGGWEEALNAFADTVGSRTGQLIAFGRDSLVPLNIMTRVADECAAEFVASGGSDPHNNSRIRLGSAAAELQVLDDADFTVEQDRARAPAFGEWMDRYDIGYSRITPLVKENGALVGIAALSARGQGAMSPEACRAFDLLVRHARAAVILRNTFEDKAVDLLTATLNEQRAAVAICDIGGKVCRLTGRAERILASGQFARLIEGSVVPRRREEREQFERRLAQALRSRVEAGVAPPRPIALSDAEGNRTLVEFLPLPPENTFAFAASVMIVFPEQADPARRRAELARELFTLTEAEEAVARMLLQGRSAAEIAAASGRTVGTIRNHLHRILDKSGCSSQVEFVAVMSRF